MICCSRAQICTTSFGTGSVLEMSSAHTAMEAQSDEPTSVTHFRQPRLSDLPEDILCKICDYVHPEALHAMAQTSLYWAEFCLHKAWPRRLAKALGVRAICVGTSDSRSVEHQSLPLSNLQVRASDSWTWLRALQTFVTYPSSRILCVCIELSKTDSVTSLALAYAVSRQDIFHTNSLFSEHQVASRTYLYIPLMTEASVLHFTGKPTRQHTPLLIKDTALSNKYFLVVKFRPSPDSKPDLESPLGRRESYVRQLVVKLIAKGLSVDEDEVRFYLDDNNFDVARAYKQLLADHNFCM